VRGKDEKVGERARSLRPSPRERGEGGDAVRAFYESNPYPAPLESLDRHKELYRNPDRRRAMSLLMWPGRPPRPDRAILVAGCGTSQAAIQALRAPAARVTAIDISETSLDHTRALQRKYGLANLELHRLAIEEAGRLGRVFDEIVATGVLHHLPDPEEGLEALRAVMAPDGAMHVMVYAAYGRAGIYMMQDYCRLLGIGPGEDELRDLGIAIEALAADHPIAALARKAKDFTYPAALADALLNPQDRAYTVPQLFDWLARCGLRFGRWWEQAPYLPQCGAIARMPHAARLAALPAPQQYAAAELLRGTMTRHNFVAYRDDRPSPAPPIDFAGDRWRRLVPLRLPWTLCIEDRAPPGFAAVLINPAHAYPDLALPITAVEEKIVAAIDGKRTVDAIIRRGDEAAGRFFERLWQYDQIVFEFSEP
jgi:SAM-dependent methyltransferase